MSLTSAGCYFDFVGSLKNGDFDANHHEGHPGWHADGCPIPALGDILDDVYNWLVDNPADIVLLHVGTNDITYEGGDANEVSDILDEIDRFSTDIKVILALIIDRRTHSTETTEFNIDVNNMAQDRITAGDDIIVVNMENALDYADMYDNLHPNDSGYAKMANIWFDALDNIINPPLIISEPIFGATIAQSYSYDVEIDANCYPQPTYSLIVCPNGMTIDHNMGLIEWLPTVAGDFDVTVEVGNGQPPDSNQSFVITVEHSIRFDAASSNTDSSDGNTLSWQHTIGSDNKRILVVGIAGEDTNVNDLVISSVSYDDVNMVLVAGSDVTVSSSGTYMKTELYYLLDDDLPQLPGDYNVVITYNGSVSKRCGGAISLADVEQQESEAVATNSNIGQDTISTNITTQTDNAWVVDVVGCGDSGSFITYDSNMTERFDVNSDSSTAAGSTKPVDLAQETTMSWTFSGANRLAHSAAAFAPALYTISGYISEPNDLPVEGVLVLADANGDYDTNDVTDANGYYEVRVPSKWSGTVMPTKDDRLFVPFERTYSNVTKDLPGQDYKDIYSFDLDDDGEIDWDDVWVICDNWLLVGTSVPGDIYKDEDNIVNFLDFAEFAQVW